jgi:DNA polymerase III epsilon subunit-like protein
VTPLVILDVETTGLGPDARVVSVAAVGLAPRSEPRLAFAWLVNPGVPIPPDATAIHGITDADVAGAPAWPPPGLLEVVGDGQVCAYNSPCEARFFPGHRWVDPFVWVRHLDKYQKGKRLADACRRRGISLVAHNATDDAIATGHLVRRLFAELWPVHKFATWEAVMDWQDREAIAQEADLWAYLGRPADFEFGYHNLLNLQPPA